MIIKIKMIKSFFLAILLLKFTFSKEEKSCIFKQCNCSNEASNIRVECISKNVEKSTFPERELNFGKKNISVLKIDGYTFTEIPKDSFDKLQIEAIIMENTTLETLKNETFQGLIGLKSLSIRQHTSLKIENAAFSPILETLNSLTLRKLADFKNKKWLLPNLEMLDLSGNEIETIPSHFFRDLPALKSLKLNENNISNMDMLLKELSSQQLSRLELARNAIETIPVEINSFSNLSVLKLSHNNIKSSLNNSTFGNLTQLREIYLDNNKLRQMSADTFRLNTNLEVVDLSRNELEMFPDLKNLEKLDTFIFNNQGGKWSELKDFAFDIMYEKYNFCLKMCGLNLI